MPGGQNTTCNLYVEDKNEEDMWEEPRRDTAPVYVAAALEWVKIGPKLQGRRGICYDFELSILNFSVDWQNAKYCYCTVRCGVVWCGVMWCDAVCPNRSNCTVLYGTMWCGVWWCGVL